MKIRALLVAMSVATVLTGCQNMDSNGLLSSGAEAFQAYSLSDAQVKTLSDQACQDMDSKATIAPANSEYAKRLTTISRALGDNINGQPVNYKVYIAKDVNAFAMANGCIRVYSGLMDMMTDNEVEAVLGHEMGQSRILLLERVQQNVTAKKAPVKAMFILSAGGSAPQVAGKGSVADAILSLAGAENVATHQQYKSYSAESLIAANPEVIVVTSQMVDGDINRLRSIAGITHTAAWKNQRIITVDQNLILGMGPRIADVVESLHQQLWPQ